MPDCDGHHKNVDRAMHERGALRPAPCPPRHAAGGCGRSCATSSQRGPV